ncbi:MAG: SAM-dependent chlorinase/fluorinase [Bacteroidetes bacterium]|nr:SAM-dependent chlorinase/fluorinase [Bacteroidota bacterium]
MKIITLTSDLGLTDHYVASLKGQIYSALGDIALVDISHGVQAFNIAQAAYYINNSWNDFPKGTIHFLNVDSTPAIHIARPDNNTYPLVMQLNGHFFMGSDNGIFSLINGYENAERLVRLDFSAAGLDLRRPARNIYIPAMGQILKGVPLEKLGDEVSAVKQAFTTQPTLEKNLIKGTVIHVDTYGNVIVNITEELFKQVGKGHPFTIFFKSSHYFIEQISDSYADVPMGEKLALFNENGQLEIAINKGTVGSGGGANSLLGLGVKDIVRVEFHPKGSKDRIQDLFTS